MKIINPSDISQELAYANEIIYKPNHFVIANLYKELESKEYSACKFTLNSLNVIFRVAKKTPRKIGQFVTLWKRKGTGPIQPFDINDSIDFFVISVRNNNQQGQFIFPKTILFEKGIISQNGEGGKRAIRVYTPWDITENRQAKATQLWQIDYFLDISGNLPIDFERVKILYIS